MDLSTVLDLSLVSPGLCRTAIPAQYHIAARYATLKPMGLRTAR